MECLFIICIEEATDFCVLILNPVTLLGVFIRCKSFLVDSVYTMMSSAML